MAPSADKQRMQHQYQHQHEHEQEQKDQPQHQVQPEDEEPIWGNGTEFMGSGAFCVRGDGLAAPWVDWMESGIEFFGCEGASGKDVVGRALMLQHNIAERIQTPKRDFAKLHEEFFESLLQEQAQLLVGGSCLPLPLDDSESINDSISSGVSSTSSLTYESQSASSIKTQKRRRPLKLYKLSPKLSQSAKVAPIDAYNNRYNPALNRNQISLENIKSKELPGPAFFIHPSCSLQKDKGKGNALGSNISAMGSSPCLDKLREKMAIVIQVSGEESKSATGMKRRTAKVSETTPGYIETRSMLELRLGFLSMQYGLLLQWDYMTGKIVFICLRKMCHDSFYSKIPDQLSPVPQTATSVTTKELEPPPLVIRNLIGNHAIYQQLMGTEVVLVDPPYRVPQPEVFAPSVLTVEVNQVTGLSKRSNWTISITFNGHTEMAHLFYNPDKKLFDVKRTTMSWEMAPVTSFDLAGLEIRLFEQPKRKNSRSRLAATMTTPLGGLVAQPSTSAATSWELTMPFMHDESAKLTLGLKHQSEYAHWLYKELDTRRTEEITAFSWRAPFRRIHKQPDDDEDEDQSDDYFDWLCGVCFKEYDLADCSRIYS